MIRRVPSEPAALARWIALLGAGLCAALAAWALTALAGDGPSGRSLSPTAWLVASLPASLLFAWLASVVARQQRQLSAGRRSLYESEEHFRVTAAAGRIGTWRLDVETGEASADRNCAAIFGLRPGEAANAKSFFDRVHPDDLPRINEALRAVAEGGETYIETYRICLPDGSIRHMSSRGEIWHDAGEGHRLLFGVTIDVTESKRNEEVMRANEARLHQVVNEAPFPIMLHADDGEVVLVNREWTRLSGYTPEEIPTIRAWTDLAYGDGAENVRSAIEALYESRGSVSEGQFTIRTRYDRQRLWDFRSAPLEPLPDGRRLVMSAAVDVSEQNLARELARSNQELERFAYVASHDLQEPLRMVASYVQLLEKRYQGQLDEEADRFIHYASDGARRMQTLVSDLLAYSRAGRGPVPDSPVDTGAILAGVLANLRVRIEETGAQISADELPPVRGHPTRIAMVFQNLVENAIKYRSDEPPVIHVGVAERDGERILYVRDNGMGFDPAQAERIFRPFQRLHGRDQFPGNGIGLALVERVVTYYGGRVWAESEPGRGSTFYLALPIAEPEPEKGS